jgi:acyl-CoA thioesterase
LRFADASAVAKVGESTWRGEVQPDWDIFGVSNGGYLMAIAARAMSEAAGGRLPVSLTSHFTKPVSAGPVEVAVEPVKVGRSFSTMRAQLASEADSLSLLGSFADPERPEHDVTYTGASPPQMPPPEECVRARPAVDGPLPPPLVAQFDQRIHPEDANALKGQPSGVARTRGWFRLLDDEPFDPFTLLLVADAFPPAIFNLDLPMGWTPTLEMTTQVRARPTTEWLRCQFTTRFVTGGLLEEDGEIWDDAGRLVALSRQLALVSR